VQLSIFYGFVLVAIAVGVLAFIGRRRQKRAKAKRSEQIAAGSQR
jgi:membrane protein implicated in regulation of membrane protease activity